MTRDGRIVAQDIDVVMDGGAYCTLTPVVLSRGVLHAGGPYAVDNVRIRSRAMATNTPPNGAFRGFGAPQSEFAAEMQVDRVAEALGMSPLELRGAGLPAGRRDADGAGAARSSVAGLEVLERAAEASRVRARPRADGAPAGAPRAPRRPQAPGIGLALAWHGAGFTGSGEVQLARVAGVELDDDGRIRVLTASTEMGQGTKTIFPQLVAAELGVDVDEVEMAPQDTSIVPDSGPTVASRTAMVVGGLVVHAARRLRAQVEERTGRPFGLSYRDDAREHGPTRVDEQFEPYPGSHFDDATYTGDAYPSFGWAAAVAEVDVDLDTARGRGAAAWSRRTTSAGSSTRSCARARSRAARSRRWATRRSRRSSCVDGRYLNDRLATYIIPTALDAPRLETILVEAPFEGAPHGAKGVGELPMDVGAPAVVAAIHDAVGAWVHDLPATPERILAALGVIEPPGPPGVSTARRRGSAS